MARVFVTGSIESSLDIARARARARARTRTRAHARARGRRPAAHLVLERQHAALFEPCKHLTRDIKSADRRTDIRPSPNVVGQEQFRQRAASSSRAS